MKTIDLTHLIHEAMPVYPGTEPPQLLPACTLEREGFAETLLKLYSHTGTHMDAPAHLVAGGATLDSLEPSRFIGKAVCLDVSDCRETIGMELLEQHRKQLEKADFVLFHTGWARRWGTEAYYDGFPVLEESAANWLACQGLMGVGIDAISFDPTGCPHLNNHMILLGSGLVLVENLKSLDQVLGEPFQLVCLPLHYERSDGAPVRALALESK